MSFRSAGVGPRFTIALPADPAPGTEIAFGANNFWRVLGVQFTFATSAAPGGRVVRLAADDDDGHELFRVGPAQVHTGPATARYSYGVGQQYPVHANSQSWGIFEAPLPDHVFLLPSWRIVTHTLALDPGDQFSGIHIFAEFVLPTPRFFPWV